MRPSDSSKPSLSPRLLTAALMVVIVVTSATGCSWFRKGGTKGDYALAPEARPLEVPPDLNLPNTDGAMQLPATASQLVAQRAQAPTSSAAGFTVAGDMNEVFGRIGDALATIDGVEIASRAELLGTYDVSYQGSSFLVRSVAVPAGVYVSAVDPRGMPATGEAPTKLIAALKAKLGG